MAERLLPTLPPRRAFAFLGGVSIILVLFITFLGLKYNSVAISTRGRITSILETSTPRFFSSPTASILDQILGITTGYNSQLSFQGVIDTNFNFGIAGTVEGSQLISSTTNLPPLIVSSTARVPSLNADLLDGKHLADIEAQIASTGSLQAAYDKGSTINLTTSDLVFNLTQGQFKINDDLASNLLTVNPAATYPVDIKKSTSVTGTLNVTGLVNVSGPITATSTLVFDDANTTSAIPLSDVTNRSLPTGTTSILGALATYGSNYWTDSGTITYLTQTTDDFAIGATSLQASLSVDVSENLLRIGNASSTDGRIAMYASDGDTGILAYTTSDDFSFQGGNVVVNQDLNVTGQLNANGNLNLGSSNLLLTGSITLSTAELALLDSGITLSELIDSGTLTANSVDINGGAIDGTTIGAATPSTGRFSQLALSSQGDLLFYDSDSSHFIAFQAPTNLTASHTWTLPGADGTSNQVLATDGSGTLFWADSSVTASSYWQIAPASGGLLTPNQPYYSLALGGSSTSSAKFYVDGTTGSASSSGTLTLGTGGTLRSAYDNLNLAYKSGPDSWTTGLTLQDGTGNVGIGTANPSDRLHLYGDYASTKMVVENPLGSQVEVRSKAIRINASSADTAGADPAYWFLQDGNYIGALWWNDDTPTGGLQLDVANSVPYGQSKISISDGVSIGEGYISNLPPTNGLIVEGSVGIGTSSPSYALHVESDIYTIRYRNYGGIVADYSSDLQQIGGISGGRNLGLFAGNFERVRISETGLVGVGTSNPESKLHLYGNYGGNAAAIIDQRNSGDILAASSSGNLKLVLNNAGTLGINTTTPNSSYKLDIAGNVKIGYSNVIDIWAPDENRARINYNNGVGTYRGLQISTLNSENRGIYFSTTDDFAFFYDSGSYNSEPKIFFDAEGNVGVNTQGDLRLYDTDSSNYTGFQAPALLSGNYLYTLPDNYGTAKYVLTTGGDGSLTWEDIASLTSDFWSRTSNVIYSSQYWSDTLAIGGTSTASAGIVLNPNGSAVFNQQGLDADFRIEASSQPNAFFIDGTTGRLGVGTNNPQALLNIVSDFSTEAFRVQQSTSDYLKYSGRLLTLAGINTHNNSLGLLLDGNGGDFRLEVGVHQTYGTDTRLLSSTGFTFKVGSTGEASAITSLRIDSSGLVGIGTTSPASRLDIQGGYAGNALVALNNTYGTDIFTASASGTTRMVLTNAGYLGIGTTLPSERLDVDGHIIADKLQTRNEINKIGNGNLNFTNYNGSYGYEFWVTQGKMVQFYGNQGVSIGGTYSSSTPPGDGLLVEGLVGFGTAVPTNQLDVNGDLGLLAQGDLRLYDTDSSNYVALQAPTALSDNYTFTWTDGYGTTGQALITGGDGSLSWSDVLTPTDQYWQLNATHNIAPINNFYNLLVGGNSTASAKIQLASTGDFTIQKPQATLLNQLSNGGNNYGVVVQGKYAYGVGSYGMRVYDITDPSNPATISTYQPSSIVYPGSIAVAGRYAYVFDKTTEYFSVVDISNPTSPTVVGTIYDPTSFNGLYTEATQISGQYVYHVDDTSDKFTVIDISNPTSPHIAGSYISSTYINGVRGIDLAGKFAYLAAANYLTVLDISDPTSPTYVGSYNSTTEIGGSYAVEVNGKYAYVAAGSVDRLTVINVANPSTPTFVTSVYDAANFDQIQSLDLAGNYLFAAAYGSDMFHIIDISNPASPTISFTVPNLNEARQVTITGTLAFLTHRSGDFTKIYRISGITSPVANIGNLLTDTLFVNEDAQITNNLFVGTGLSVGSNGILSQGNLSVLGTTTLHNNISLNAQADLRLYDTDSSNYTGFQAPSSLAGNYLYTLPSNFGSANYVLTSGGDGSLTWEEVSGLTTDLWTRTSNVLYSSQYWSDALAIGGTSTASAGIVLNSDGSAIFNQQGNDTDFRIEASGQPNALFIDGSTGNIGIGTSSPTSAIQITGSGSTNTTKSLLIKNSINQEILSITDAGVTTITGNVDGVNHKLIVDDGISFQGYHYHFHRGTTETFRIHNESAANVVNLGLNANSLNLVPLSYSVSTLYNTTGVANPLFRVFSNTNPSSNANEFIGLYHDQSNGIITTGKGDLNLSSATGNVNLLAQGDLRLYDTDSSNYTGFQAPASLAGNYVYTLPGNYGTGGYVLTSGGDGSLSWSDVDTLTTDLWTRTSNVLYSSQYWSDALTIGGTSTASAGIVLNPDGSVVFNQQGNDADFRIEGSSEQNLFFVDAGTDRIGIGTNTPSSKFHIVGSGGLTVVGTDNLSTTLGALAAGPALNLGNLFQIGAYSSVNNIDTKARNLRIFSNNDPIGITYLTTGQFGIGTTAPTNKLEVSGDLGLLAQGDLRLYDTDSSNYTGFQAPETLTGNIVYTLPSADGSGNFVMMTDGSGNLSWSDPTLLTGGTNLWASANGTLYPKNSSLDLLLGGQATSSAKVGLIGINTDTPAATIAGNLSLKSTVGNAQTSYIDLFNNSRLDIRQSAGGEAGLTSRLYINQAGNVGIGTSNSNSRLTVDGSTSLADFSGLILSEPFSNDFRFAVPGVNGDRLRLTNTLAEIRYIGNEFEADANGVRLRTNNLDRLTITNDGYVGIGTSTPTSFLHIDGSDYRGNALITLNETGSNDLFTASASGSTRLVLTNAGQLQIKAEDSAATGLAIGTDTDLLITSSSGNAYIENRTQDKDIAFTVNDGGQIKTQLFIDGSTSYTGIGTTNPSRTLSVIGNGIQIGQGVPGTGREIFISQDDLGLDMGYAPAIFSDTAQGMKIYTKNSTNLRFGANNTEVMRITSTGNLDLLAQGDLRLYDTDSSNYTGFKAPASLSGNFVYTIPSNYGSSGYVLTTGGDGSLTWEDVASLTSDFWSRSSNVIYSFEYWSDSLAIGGTSTDSAGIVLHSDGSAIFNQQGNDADFRIEGDTQENLFFVDASTNRIGIGTNAPSYLLDVAGNARVNGNLAIQDRIFNASTTSNNTYIELDHNNRIFEVALSGTSTIYGTTFGRVGLGTTSPASRLDIQGGYAGNAAFTVNQTNTGDVLTASASGTTKLQLTNAGELVLSGGYLNFGTTAGSDGHGLRVNADAIEYKDSSGAWTALNSLGSDPVSPSYFSLTDQVLHPGNTTLDLAIGGTSTASAKFHISADTGNASSSGNLTLGANAAIRTAYGNLNLEYKSGADSWATGLTLEDITGNIGIGTSSPLTKLQVLSTSTQLRLGYDAANYTDFTVASDGSLTIAPKGTAALTISSSKITSALPHEFTAAGDVGFAYNIELANQTASFIKSRASLSLEVGEIFESNNLTLRTYNSGDLFADVDDFLIGTGSAKGKFTISQPEDDYNEAVYIDSEMKNATDRVWALESDTTNNSQTADTVKAHFNADGSLYISLTGTQTSNALCHATNGQTNNDEIVDCTGTPAGDYAEMYPVENGTTYGEVVALSQTEVITQDGQSIRRLDRATSPYQAGAIGIVVDNYGDFTSAGYNIHSADNPMPVALVGRVPVKMASDSPALEPGDRITSSSQPGRASKATQAGQILGTAIGSWQPNSGKDTVMVYVNRTWYDPQLYLSDIGSLQTRVSSLESQVSSHASDIASLQGQVAGLETDFASLASEFSTTRLGIGLPAPASGSGKLIDTTSGAFLSEGGVWTNTSDQNLKENFQALDRDLILSGINSLTLTQWNYKSEADGVTHIGPLAQDFYRAFGLGGSDTSISTIDPAGIALVGIQALSGRYQALQADLADTRTDTRALAEATTASQSYLSSLKQTLDYLPSLLASFQSQLASLQSQLATALGRLDQLDSQANPSLTSPIARFTDLTATGSASLAQVNTNLITPLSDTHLTIDLSSSGVSSDDSASQGFGQLTLKGNLSVSEDATIAGNLTAGTGSFGTLITDELQVSTISAGTILGLDDKVDTRVNHRLVLLEEKLSALEAQKAASLPASPSPETAPVPSEALLPSGDDPFSLGDATSHESFSIGTDSSTDAPAVAAVDSDKLLTEIDSLTASTASAELLTQAKTQDIIKSFLAAQDDLDSSAFADIDGLLVHNFLGVTGLASLVRAEVTNFLTVGGRLLVDGNSISTLRNCTGTTGACDHTLFLQPAGGSLNLVAGLMTLDSTGLVTVTGDLTVEGILTAGAIKTQDLSTNSLILGAIDAASPSGQLATSSAALATTTPPAISQFGQLLTVYGENGEVVASLDASGSGQFNQIATNQLIIASEKPKATMADFASITYAADATTGTAALPAGKTKLVIQNPHINAGSLLFMTPLSDTQGQVPFATKQLDNPLTSKNEAAIIITINQSITSPLDFNWWIVNSTN